jgi:hypothetical protein
MVLGSQDRLSMQNWNHAHTIKEAFWTREMHRHLSSCHGQLKLTNQLVGFKYVFDAHINRLVMNLITYDNSNLVNDDKLQCDRKSTILGAGGTICLVLRSRWLL